MTTYAPCNDYILILPDPPRTMMGSLHLPEGVTAEVTRGTVQDVGNRTQASLKAGDRVEYLPGAHPTVQDSGGARLLLVQEQFILARVLDEPVDASMEMRG